MASLILAIHFGIILFNIFGLITIPLGGWRNWAFVREPIWRWLHLASFAVVAIQVILGRACFLTSLQDDLTGGVPESQPLIARWIDAIIYWPIPIWVFGVGYVAIFGYVAALNRAWANTWASMAPRLKRDICRPHGQ